MGIRIMHTNLQQRLQLKIRMSKGIFIELLLQLFPHADSTIAVEFEQSLHIIIPSKSANIEGTPCIHDSVHFVHYANNLLFHLTVQKKLVQTSTRAKYIKQRTYDVLVQLYNGQV